MDKKDIEILSLLQKDASIALGDLAKAVNLSSTPCWRRVQKLHDGAGGAMTLHAFFERVDELEADADERGQHILSELVDYATEIAPDR